VDDPRLTAALDRFKRLVDTKAADPAWYRSEEGVRESLAAALREELELRPDEVVFECLSGAHRTDLWLRPLELALELKFHRAIQSGHTRPLTQQFGDLLADCSKLASAPADDRVLVLVTDAAGYTHLTNKSMLPTVTTSPAKTLTEEDVRGLAATASRVALYPGPWPRLSVQLIWRGKGPVGTFLAWRVRPEI
jgi:hypothetical protein